MSKTKIKDILDYEFKSGLLISDNKKKLAYKKTKANYDENKYESDLWIYDVDEKDTYAVTDQKDASIYSFDKDANLIYKYKSEDKKDIFYKTNDHGVGTKAFEIDKDVNSIKHLKDDLFLINASEKKSKEEKDEEKEDSYFKELTTLPFWLNGPGYLKWEANSYYFYDAKEDKLTKIIDSNIDHDINFINFNDDLTHAVYTITNFDKNKVMDRHEALYIYDIKNKESKEIIKPNFSYMYADFIGDKIIFIASDMKKGGINEDDFIFVSDFDGNFEKITTDDFDMAFGNSLGTDSRFGSATSFKVANNKLYFVVTEKENALLYSIDLDGNVNLVIDDEVEDFAIKDDEIYYFSMSEDRLAELKKLGEEEVLIESKIESKTGKLETFNFVSNGDELKGFVLLPPKFDKDKKYPTILSVHGGPKTEFGSIYHHEHNVFATDGYIVIYTNPHGSSGNGVAYSDIRGLYGDKDYDDLMTLLIRL